MSVTEHKVKPEDDSDEDLLITIRPADIRLVWNFVKKSILSALVFALVGAAIGTYYALSKSDEYVSQVIVISEAPTGGGGDLGPLAGLASLGLGELGSSGGGIRPSLYPNVVKSTPFALFMAKQPVYSKLFHQVMPLKTFLKRQPDETPAGKIKEWFRGPKKQEESKAPPLEDPKGYSKALEISPEDEGWTQEIKSRVTVNVNGGTGFIIIESTMPDPVVAATTARLSLEYLTRYVVSYRTDKFRQQVDFLSKRVQEFKRRYEQAQYTLESYRDRNRSLFGNLAKVEEQRLQADFLLAQSIYNDLLRQLEQVNIKVQEETPVFKMLEPPKLPPTKNPPKRMALIIVGTLVGFAIGVAWSLLRVFIKRKRTETR